MHRRPCCQSCSNPETWIKTGAQGRMRTRVEGPNSQETIYEVPFNEKNLKTLFDKRITPEDLKLMGQRTRLKTFIRMIMLREFKISNDPIWLIYVIWMYGFKYPFPIEVSNVKVSQCN